MAVAIWNAIAVLLFGAASQNIVKGADFSCIYPICYSNVNFTCDDPPTECQLECRDGFILEGPSTIFCICPESPTTQVLTTEATTTVETAATESYATTQPDCTWNPSTEEISCQKVVTDTTESFTSQTDATTGRVVAPPEPSSTPTEKYVSWKDFWIATGILIAFVFLLLLATIFLLWVHFRRGTTTILPPKNKPEVIRNSYAPTDEGIPMRQFINIEGAVTQSDDDESDISSVGYSNKPRFNGPPAAGGVTFSRPPLPAPRDQSSADHSRPPTPKIPPKLNQPAFVSNGRKRPAILPKPLPGILQENQDRPFSDSSSIASPRTSFPEIQYRNQSGTADSDDGYDNDPTEPEVPAPNLPARNVNPEQEQPVYSNQEEEEIPYYEEPNAILRGGIEDDNMYSDVITVQQTSGNDDTCEV